MELYHPIILKHNSKPFQFAKMDDPTMVVEAYNPVCGDQFNIYLKIKDQTILDATFHGYGCAVSKASTSMLIERLIGQSVDQAHKIVDDFLIQMSSESSLSKEGQAITMIDADDIGVLLVAKKYPGREQCAILAWEAFGQIVKI